MINKSSNDAPYPVTAIYPKFYYCKRGDSDIAWIMRMMSHVPEEKKLEVSSDYEWLFLRDNHCGRKAANTYLHGIAKGFKDNG